VKCRKNIFIYLNFFSLISLQVRPVYGFLRVIAQKTWNHARMCLLGVLHLFIFYTGRQLLNCLALRPLIGPNALALI